MKQCDSTLATVGFFLIFNIIWQGKQFCMFHISTIIKFQAFSSGCQLHYTWRKKHWLSVPSQMILRIEEWLLTLATQNSIVVWMHANYSIATWLSENLTLIRLGTHRSGPMDVQAISGQSHMRDKTWFLKLWH